MNIFSSEARFNSELYFYSIAALCGARKVLDEQDENFLNNFSKGYHLDSYYDSILYGIFDERSYFNWIFRLTMLCSLFKSF